MNHRPLVFISLRQRVIAWSVHLLTASGGIFGLLALNAIHHQQFLQALWLMGGAVLVDAVDGVLARRARTDVAAPEIDGALLDNLVDFVNYVVVPAFFMVVGGLLPQGWQLAGAGAVVLASAYQFSQLDAKTEDHFFKGFPSYWNLVVFYLFLLETSRWANLAVIAILSLLVFVPVKYVYPSRMEYLSSSLWVRRAMLGATVLWGMATAGLLWLYPETSRILLALSLGYVLLYVSVSLYRTVVRLGR